MVTNDQNNAGYNRPDKARVDERLNDLKNEYKAGEAQLKALEQRTKELQATMLRIAGAIQVLEELLASE